MSQPQTYRIAFRTGGTANFKWQYGPTFRNERDARACQYEMLIAGHRTYVYNEQHVRHGLPDTFGEIVTTAEIEQARRSLSVLNAKRSS